MHSFNEKVLLPCLLVLFLQVYKNRGAFYSFFETPVEEDTDNITRDELIKIEKNTIFIACYLLVKHMNRTSEYYSAFRRKYSQIQDSSDKKANSDKVFVDKLNIFNFQKCLEQMSYKDTIDIIDSLNDNRLIDNKKFKQYTENEILVTSNLLSKEFTSEERSTLYYINDLESKLNVYSKKNREIKGSYDRFEKDLESGEDYESVGNTAEYYLKLSYIIIICTVISACFILLFTAGISINFQKTDSSESDDDNPVIKENTKTVSGSFSNHRKAQQYDQK